MYAGRTIQFFIDVQFPDDSLYDALLVIRVKDNEIRTDRQILCFSPQNSGADRVKGAQHDPLNCLVWQKGFDARLHLLGGFIGECDGQDLPRSHPFHGDQVSDPLSQHACLAGPGSSHHQNRPVPCSDCRQLLFVKFVKNFHEMIIRALAGSSRSTPPERVTRLMVWSPRVGMYSSDSGWI